jgi:lipopolysaccharide transport system ATP-binding protein
MDKNVSIKMEHVFKKFCKSLRKSMWYGIKDIIRNSLGSSSHSERLRKDEFWALDDISFEIKKGETFGVIGPNGSGKTTLLKLLNGIFWPDNGKITIKGKVGAIIEVGAGFHPLLTGRRNIYINGAILGMTKKEIDKKFESIVNFADIGDFIDVPVKYYSSGMFVRLGFAVAAHCEPNILLVDEVLAVGDINFQAKCFEFMTENVLKKGCTVVFVSHNRYSVQDLCHNALYLKSGKIVKIGETMGVIEKYLEDIKNEEMNRKPNSQYLLSKDGDGITDISFLDIHKTIKNKFKSGEKISIRFYFSFKKSVTNPSVSISFFHIDPRYRLVSSTDYIFNLHSGYDGFEISTLEGRGYFEVTIDGLYLPIGVYQFSIYLFLDNKMNLAKKYENTGEIEIISLENSPKRSLVELPHNWTLNKEE